MTPPKKHSIEKTRLAMYLDNDPTNRNWLATLVSRNPEVDYPIYKPHRYPLVAMYRG